MQVFCSAKTALVSSTMLGILTACVQDAGRQLYVAHDTVVGINAHVNNARNSGSLIIGYDRNFVALVPRSVTTDTNHAPKDKEAMSAISCSKMEIKRIFLTKFIERLATGQAAETLASSINDSSAAFNLKDCFGAKSSAGGS